MKESQTHKYARTPRPLWDAIKLLSREKRYDPTPAENHLWQRLRRQQISGLQFRRQHSIDRFIVDFYCPAAKLVIEVDGEIHQYTREEDRVRQAFLESMGLCVLRFTNNQVLIHTSDVIEIIQTTIQSLSVD